MASGDYMYYVLPKMDEMQNAGIVRVQFPTKDNLKRLFTYKRPCTKNG
jgi:hypothetical protein